MRQIERAIQNAILDFLHIKPKCFAVEFFNQGIYQRSKRSFVKNTKYRPSGMPDILCFYKGIPVMIEVKSAKGRLSPEQKKMHERLIDHGCQVVVCRSVKDAETLLIQLDHAISHVEGENVSH